MARIYRSTDKLMVKIGDSVQVTIAPMDYKTKNEVQSLMVESRKTSKLELANEGMRLALKSSVKGITGLVDGDGQPYALSFENNVLADSCINDLLNCEVTNELVFITSSLVNGVPSQFKDLQGNPLSNVEIIQK